jgi:hypothetical protein
MPVRDQATDNSIYHHPLRRRAEETTNHGELSRTKANHGQDLQQEGLVHRVKHIGDVELEQDRWRLEGTQPPSCASH